MTSHVTTLPSSIGRLTLGLASHYAPSPIPEQEEIQSPVSSGKCEILSHDSLRRNTLSVCWVSVVTSLGRK